MITFGQYSPDQPILGSPFCSVARNVVPKTQKSFGPQNSMGIFSTALTARCQGAFSCKNMTGTPNNFAGDATKLYLINGSTWTDVSKSGGYNTTSEEFWEFIQFDDYVIATNFADAVQSYQFVVSSNFGNLSSGAPNAKHVGKIDPGFVMLGNLVGAPNRIHWGELNNPTSWPTPGTSTAEAAQSNQYDLPSGGEVQRIIGAVGGADGLIFMQNAVYRVAYVGTPSVFQFQEIERGRGVDAPHSIVNVGPFVIYLGVDGFYKTDGISAVPIGIDRVDKTFLNDVDDDFINRVVGCLDPISKLIYWIYPSSSTGGGTCDRAMIYDYALDRWSDAELTTEYIVQSLSAGSTLESLDSVSSSLDALSLSLDHRSFAGGRGSIGLFDSAHKLNFFTGSSLTATLETGEFDPENQRIFVSGIRCLIDGGTVTAAVGHRNTPNGSVTFTTATSVGSDGICPQRISTRYAKVRVSIAAGGTWSHAQGIEPVYRLDGRR